MDKNKNLRLEKVESHLTEDNFYYAPIKDEDSYFIYFNSLGKGANNKGRNLYGGQVKALGYNKLNSNSMMAKDSESKKANSYKMIQVALNFLISAYRLEQKREIRFLQQLVLDAKANGVELSQTLLDAFKNRNYSQIILLLNEYLQGKDKFLSTLNFEKTRTQVYEEFQKKYVKKRSQLREKFNIEVKNHQEQYSSKEQEEQYRQELEKLDFDFSREFQTLSHAVARDVQERLNSLKYYRNNNNKLNSTWSHITGFILDRYGSKLIQIKDGKPVLNGAQVAIVVGLIQQKISEEMALAGNSKLQGEAYEIEVDRMLNGSAIHFGKHAGGRRKNIYRNMNLDYYVDQITSDAYLNNITNSLIGEVQNLPNNAVSYSKKSQLFKKIESSVQREFKKQFKHRGDVKSFNTQDFSAEINSENPRTNKRGQKKAQGSTDAFAVQNILRRKARKEATSLAQTFFSEYMTTISQLETEFAINNSSETNTVQDIIAKKIGNAVRGDHSGQTKDDVIGYLIAKKKDNKRIKTNIVNQFEEKLQERLRPLLKEYQDEKRKLIASQSKDGSGRPILTDRYYEGIKQQDIELRNKLNIIFNEVVKEYEREAEVIKTMYNKFIIEGNVKNYDTSGDRRFSPKQGFDGGSLGANLEEQIKNLKGILNSAKLTGALNFDDEWLKFAILNSGKDMIGNKNQTLLEKFLSAFMGLLLFDDAFLFAEDINNFIASEYQLDNNSTQTLHLYNINDMYWPASFILYKTYTELNAWVLNQFKNSASGYNVKINNKGKDESPYKKNQAPKIWYETYNKVENQTNLTITFFGNFIETLNSLIKNINL